MRCHRSSRLRSVAILAALASCVSLGSARATLITSNSLSSPTVLDFVEFDTSPVLNAAGPIQIGTAVGENIEFSGAPNTGLYGYNSTWGLVSNGGWDGDRVGFLGADDARSGEMLITFHDGPVAGVGAFMNHCPDCDASQPSIVISAYAANGDLLESHDVTDIVTPGGLNAGAFRGIVRGAADIASFGVRGYVPVLDDLAFSRVPEPSSALLLAAGLGALARRRRASA